MTTVATLTDAPLLFRLDRRGPELATARQGRDLARDLAALLDIDCPPVIVLDAAGVDRAWRLPLHQLLKETRKRLQVHYPDAVVRFVNVGSSVQKALDVVVQERRDFAVTAAGAAGCELTLTCPATIIVDGEVLAIGSRRRAMLAVIARDGHCCVWCSKELAYDHPEASLDHVRPYSSNGSNKISNLLLACSGCNHARRKRSPGNWLKSCLERGLAVNEVAVRAAIKRMKNSPTTRRSVLATRHERAEARAAARSL